MKCFFWIEKLKSISKANIFFEGFQLAKLVEIQYPHLVFGWSISTMRKN